MQNKANNQNKRLTQEIIDSIHNKWTLEAAPFMVTGKVFAETLENYLETFDG